MWHVPRNPFLMMGSGIMTGHVWVWGMAVCEEGRGKGEKGRHRAQEHGAQSSELRSQDTITKTVGNAAASRLPTFAVSQGVKDGLGMAGRARKARASQRPPFDFNSIQTPILSSIHSRTLSTRPPSPRLRVRSHPEPYNSKDQTQSSGRASF